MSRQQGPTERWPVVTVHAIERYRERVDAMATPGQAVEALTTIALRGRRRPRARRWMRGTAAQPGAIFVYAALVPGVCLVMRERAIITVFSRTSCKAWRASHGRNAEPRVTRGENLRQDELVDIDEAA